MKIKVTVYPKSLYRDDDGQEFRLNEDYTYSIFPQNTNNKYPFKYSYETLINHGFKTKLKDCNIELIERKYSGCEDNE